MIDWQNRILTNVKIKLGDKCTNVVSGISNGVAVFPTCSVTMISNNAIADDLSVDDGSENAVYCGIEIRIYVKTSASDAKTLMEPANKAMYLMGFKRNGGFYRVNDPMSPEVYQFLARYTRVIGADDMIDRFETD